ncbi:hypothetical protein LXL04_002686 [Taraxacum kok-saghyz]
MKATVNHTKMNDSENELSKRKKKGELRRWKVTMLDGDADRERRECDDDVGGALVMVRRSARDEESIKETYLQPTKIRKRTKLDGDQMMNNHVTKAPVTRLKGLLSIKSLPPYNPKQARQMTLHCFGRWILGWSWPAYVPVEYRTILKYRLLIPLFSVDKLCSICRKACLDSFGEHAIHCKNLPGFKYQHDMVRDVLFDVFRRAGISAKKEAPVNFLTDPLEGRSTLRPADILVFGWIGGKHACVDLTGVSPLVGLRNEGFTMGQAALKAASCKVMKHEKACIENQHVFIPFAFNTFGFLAPEAVDLLNRVQRGALAVPTWYKAWGPNNRVTDK